MPIYPRFDLILPENLSKVEVHHLLIIEYSDRKVNQILGNSYSKHWKIGEDLHLKTSGYVTIREDLHLKTSGYIVNGEDLHLKVSGYIVKGETSTQKHQVM